MGCSSCGSHNSDGTPRGCGNKGTCSSGGCNKLEVYDWLSNMSLPFGQKPFELIEVRFKNGRKHLFRNTKEFTLYSGDIVVVESTPGYDVGVVSLTGELVRVQQEKKYADIKVTDLKKVMRIANQEDIDKWKEGRTRETELMYKSRELASKNKLDMKISDVECQGDLTKATFYYTAEDRVDFRQLIKDMADTFKLKIEMRQIGARQEAARLGGIGSCGRELCCSTWLTDFRSVSTSAARYQQLSLNPQKLAGQCGKLKCCLNYELDMYLEGIKSFPSVDIRLKTEKGDAYHVKTDIFKKLMWYSVDNSNALVALEPNRVADIIEINKKGKNVKDLIEYAAETQSAAAIAKVEFIATDEDDSFNRLAQALTSGNKKSSNNKKRRPSNDNRNSGSKPQRPRPVEGTSDNRPKQRPENRKPNPNQTPKTQGNQPSQVKKDEQKPVVNSGERKEGSKRPNNNKRRPNPNRNKPNPNKESNDQK